MGDVNAGRDEDEEGLLSGEEATRELEEVAYTGGDRSGRSVMRKTAPAPRARSGRGCKVTCSHLVCTVMAVLVAAVISLAVGLFVGQSLGRKAVHCGEEPTPTPTCSPTLAPTMPAKVLWGDTVTIGGKTLNVSDYFTDHVSEYDIKKYLFNLTSLPHIAGSDRNKELAMMMYDEWKQYGFDNVDLFNYTVLLSYPNTSHPNSLTLRQSNGQLLYQSHIAQEPPLTPGEDNPDVVPPFNAYSGSGNVTGPLVYVNYGRLPDFQFLMNSSHNLNLTGYICIVRYGKIFRGDKAHLAQRFGCKGLLIYSDPQDYAPDGVPIYPDGPSLPEYGVQRGSLQISDGDILTPGVPALSGMNRRAYSEALAEGSVPRIPVQPISYGDAAHFMSQLSEITPPDDWVGGLQVEYKIVQAAENDNYTELVVNNYQEQKEIHNVVAKLYGAVEPDRQVILGNHRDAWIFGAVDPNSGTASLMNLAKVIGQLREDSSWRPGRTIVLCSWDAEEYGLIGSTEWVEDYGKILGTNTMAYLNVDSGVSGQQSLKAYASPLLYEVLWKAAAMVRCPNKSFPTVYDEWLAHDPGNYNGVTRPKIGNLGSGTDYTAMIQLHGISSSDFTYEGEYDVYHSVHDNFYWMSHFGDPSFSHHRAVATIWMTVALLLTTTPLPPIDPSYYSHLLVGEAAELEMRYKDVLAEHSIFTDFMMRSVHELEGAFQSFQDTLEMLKASTNISEQLNVVRIVNNILMNVERAFIHPEGLPGRPYYKHIIFAPSSINSYGSTVFPGLSDAITNAIEFEGSWEEVKTQLDIVVTHLRYATQTIQDPSFQHALDNSAA